MTHGKFITLEGIDGAGKSTHVQAVAAKLRARIAKEVVVTREPGGTELGEKLRVLLLTEAMHAETEALLMFAARREHIERVIAPALALGRWVVSDRFSDASFAYQGGGRGVAARKLIALEDWVHAELQPDLTLLFDLPAQAAQRRVAASTPALDRFEREQVGFFERVRAAYLERARCNPDRIVVIDAARPLSEVSEQVELVITQRL